MKKATTQTTQATQATQTQDTLLTLAPVTLSTSKKTIVLIKKNEQVKFNKLAKEFLALKELQDKLNLKLDSIKESLQEEFNISADNLTNSTDFISNCYRIPVTFKKAYQSIDTKKLKKDNPALYDELLKLFPTFHKQSISIYKPEKIINNVDI